MEVKRMIIMKDHAMMLQNLYRKGEVDVSFYTKEQRETLWQLELAGLVRLAGIDEYELTFAGNMLAEILENLIEEEKLAEPSDWDSSFRWVGSEIISMIRYGRQAQGRVRGKVAEVLEHRGFAENGQLTPEAEALSDVYNASHPRLIITKELAEYIKKMPPGPGERGRLPVEGGRLLEMEAMRLIAFSVPTSDVYALTGMGQQIRMALKKGAATFMDVVIDESILELLARAALGNNLSDTEKEILMIRGFMGMNGEILPAGEHLYLAYKFYRKGVYKKIPTFHVDDLEIKLMDVIDLLWKKFEQNPEIFPTRDQIRKYVKDNWDYKEYDVTLALFNLESFDLIISREHRKGSGKYLVYDITPYGREVMENRTNKDISSEAVKAITITRLEFAAPNVEWYELARDVGLVSDAYPTKAGLMFARLAVDVNKRPLITKIESKLLARIPFTRGLFIDDELIAPYFKGEEEDAKIALQKLEAKGLVNLLPTGVVVLTEAGRYMKRALSGTPTGLATPVTPLVIRLLQAVRDVGSLYVKEHKVRIKPENWKHIERAVGVDPDTFNKVLVLAKEAKFILTNSLSEAGMYLLKAVDEINKKEHEWEEVLVEV